MSVDMTVPAAQAPFPLTRIQAFHKAADLKRKNMPWKSIAVVMGEYHGQWLSADQWSRGVLQIGLEVPRREVTPAKLAHLRRLAALNGERGRLVA